MFLKTHFDLLKHLRYHRISIWELAISENYWWIYLNIISYLFFRSRKRRTSETLIDDEETMTECSAAMLLMKLSCSPGSNPAMAAAMLLTNFENSGINGHSGSLPSYPNMPSPVDSSGKDLHVCNYEVSRKLKVHILKNKIYPNMPGYAWSWQNGKIEVWINGKKWTGWTFEHLNIWTNSRERENKMNQCQKLQCWNVGEKIELFE